MKYFALTLLLSTACALLPPDTEIEVYNQVLPAVLEGEDRLLDINVSSLSSYDIWD